MSGEARDACAALLDSVKSLHMATLGEDGHPHCGYTPFLRDGRDFLIFTSQLAVHTRNLLLNPQVSIMLIADEHASRQIFARTRVSYHCRAEPVAREHPDWESLLDRYQAHLGNTVKMLRTLPDFVLFRLRPESGQFVMGFGQAYALAGDNLDQFEHTRTG